jgi:hypothetical protein
MSDADTYDAAARKLQAALTAAFPDCKWWVPTSFDMIRWDMQGWGDMIEQGRLEVQVKRDGYAARVPVNVEIVAYNDAIITAGKIAMYTMDRYRYGDDANIDISKYGFKRLPDL